MDLKVLKTDFVNGRYTKQINTSTSITLTIVDEVFAVSADPWTITQNRINTHIEYYDNTGQLVSGKFGSSIIGIGDGSIGVLSDDTALLGHTLTYDNIESCVIRVYE